MTTNYSPYPKNPILARFFKQIGRADELGSGVRNMLKYSEAYGGHLPELNEGDIFKMTIKLFQYDSLGNKLATTNDTAAVTAAVTPAIKLAKVLKGEMTRQELQLALGLKHNEHFRKVYLLPALADGLIQMTKPDKPNSRLQKYRLTEKGQHILEGANA